MSAKLDLYNSSYGNYERDVYREVRQETYGEDFGQTSWVTTEESHEIPRLLELTSNSSVLEIGCGSGRYALYVAEVTGCRVVGLDLNSEGIRNASALAERQNLSSQVHFQQCDVSRPLRSSIGYYLFAPPGENEKLIQAVGFQLMGVTDTTDNAALVAKRWHDSREKRKSELIALEGEANFSGLQKFLTCVHTLTIERRLLRFVYVARK